ncbi:MAG: cytochrome P450 [Anaerolineales bacterium]|nr:cytochrome P450 [Anaerolineales bacterium]
MTPTQTPPAYADYPIVGALPKVWRAPLQFFVEAAASHRVVRLNLGPRSFYLLSHPDDVRYVLQDNARNYVKGYDMVKPVLGDGLVTANGDLWLRQRRLMQPAFHRQKIAGLADQMTGAAAEMLERWGPLAQRGAPLDLAAEMMQLTQTIIVRTMFSTDLSADAPRLMAAFSAVLEYLNTLIFAPVNIPVSWPTPTNVRFRRALGLIEGTVYRIIAERRQAGRSEPDLLSMLLDARDENGQGMSEKQIRDELLTIFFAGHETTASTLAWTWWLLGQHPEPYARLEAEVASVLGGRRPAFADLPGLAYTRQIIDEALRLYPPAWMFTRTPVADDEIAGYRVPAGVQVMLSPYITQRLPEFWEAPAEFRPERFAPGAEAGRPKLAYFPFAAGPRQCLGKDFALVEAALLLAAMVQRYRVRLAPGQTVRALPIATLRPQPGVLVTLQAR